MLQLFFLLFWLIKWLVVLWRFSVEPEFVHLFFFSGWVGKLMVANALLILNFAAPTARAQVTCAPRLTLVFPPLGHSWTPYHREMLPGPSAASKSANLSRV